MSKVNPDDIFLSDEQCYLSYVPFSLEKQSVNTDATPSTDALEKLLAARKGMKLLEEEEKLFGSNQVQVGKINERKIRLKNHTVPLEDVNARNSISALSQTAKNGDWIAAAKLYDLAAFACQKLAELAEMNPKLLRQTARHRNYFPANTGRNIADVKRVKKNLITLQVSEDSAYHLIPRKKGKGRQKDFSEPINELAQNLCAYIGLCRVNGRGVRKPRPDWLAIAINLPDLPDAPKEWGKVAQEILKEVTKGKPEKFEPCKSMYEARREHSKYIGQQKAATPGTADCNQRNRILDELQKAVMRIAKPRN